MRRLFGAAFAASVLLTASGGRADEVLPLSYAERPLTLPRLVLEPIGEIEVAHETGTLLNLGLGVAFGIADDFQVDVIALPLELTPSVTYGQAEQPGPRLGLTYRLGRGLAEVGVHIDATVITLPDSSGFVLRPGLPFRFHTGEKVRLDMGFYVPVTVARTTAAGFDAPFSFAVNASEPFYLGLSSGLSFATFEAPFDVVLPLGVFAGYAIGGKDGPILDIDPFLRWPELVSFAPQSVNTATVFQAGVQIRWFLYL
jgi:hypothetical protein